MNDTQHLIVAAHEGLAWNIQTFGRDYIQNAYVTRRQGRDADLQKLPALLRRRGYSERDVHGIMGENWIHVLRDALPETHNLETGGF